MNDWQRGYSLPLLKEYADVFRQQHKALVFGAFGLVKERDVAAALADDNAIFSKNAAGTIAAVALYKLMKTDGNSVDFAGNPIVISRGSVSIRAFACTDIGAGVRVLTRAADAMQRGGLFVEIFEEDENARAAVAHVGLRWFASKVTAGAEVKGVYWNGPERSLAANEALTLARVFPQQFIAEDEQTAIFQEAITWRDGAEWAQHYSSYNKRKSWTSVAIRGYDAQDPDFIIKPAEMSKFWKEENAARIEHRPAWTIAAPHFETCVRIAELIPGEKDRVRLMKLSKGGELTRHADITDREAGASVGKVARFHIPIRTTPLVRFNAWDARGTMLEMNMQERGLYYLDQRKPHRVINGDPNFERLHLVIDTVITPEVEEWLSSILL